MRNAVLALAVAMWRARRRGTSTSDSPARRARSLAEKVLAAYRHVHASEPHLDPDDRLVKALLASGKPEAEIRAVVARAPSPLHKTLTMLTVSFAVDVERGTEKDPEALRKAIASAQRAVMDVIPMDP